MGKGLKIVLGILVIFAIVFLAIDYGLISNETEVDQGNQEVSRIRPLIDGGPYEPPRINKEKSVPFCDGARAVSWNPINPVLNLDEGSWHYFGGIPGYSGEIEHNTEKYIQEGLSPEEANRKAKEYTYPRAWRKVEEAFKHICNTNHWELGPNNKEYSQCGNGECTHSPITFKNVGEFGYFYLPN